MSSDLEHYRVASKNKEGRPLLTLLNESIERPIGHEEDIAEFQYEQPILILTVRAFYETLEIYLNQQRHQDEVVEVASGVETSLP